MPRICTVCSHPKRHEIDRALASDVSNRRIATQYDLTEPSIRRHKAEHLAARIVKAAEQTDVRNAIDIVSQLKAINGASLHILKEARERKDGDLALRAIDRIQKQIELQAKLIGELQQEGTTNITIAPQWLSIRTVVMAALAEYPDASTAVAAALIDLEDGERRAVA